MYIEDNYSKSLVALNHYYLTITQNSNTSIYRILKKKLGIIKEVALLPRNGVKKTSLKIRARLFEKTITDRKLSFSPNDRLELDYCFSKDLSNTRVAVYTSIFGGYDSINDPLYCSPNCDYYIVTDQDVPYGSKWNKIDTSKLEGFDDLDNYKKSKYCKLFPHKLFPNYEYSIWVDGNILIIADLMPLIDRLENHFIGMFNNPVHDCIYTEAGFVTYYDYANYDLLSAQMKEYSSDGMPKHFGMRECSVIVRQHCNEECTKLMEQWWNQLCMYTMRDQLSLPYILWKNGKTIDFIQLLGDSWRWNPRFVQLGHNRHIKF